MHRGYDMNEFTKAETKLVDDICILMSWEITMMEIEYSYQLMARIKKYAQPEDREAAAKAVIELVRDRLNESH